ncbi:VOC family protein [Nocardioides sp. YIM 152315]|uniref:VOC family protein n=1 Tax=Nocardioides sp. YIM 152315 TaxID=3031760 RepID=UPI0023DC2647|nr:VOC family protein [Nocardioides sp. YIM 152315]MDF1603208.1 VOC family protein [Nocardioides sp. YIM 152315]
MTADIAAIVFSCREPRRVAEFWAHVLGRDVAATAGEESAAVLAQIPLFFRRAEAGSTNAGGVHLDLSTEDLDAEAARLRGLGATEVRRNQWHSTESVTFVDIEGNQFDLIAD